MKSLIRILTLVLVIGVGYSSVSFARPPKVKKRKLSKETSYFSSRYKNADVNKCPKDAKKKGILAFL